MSAKNRKRRSKAGSKSQLMLANHVRIICVLLSVCGLILSVVLTSGYYTHVVGGQATGCAINSYVDCDRVSSSAFSAIAGIPISAIGFGLHLLLATLMTFGMVAKSADARTAAAGFVLLLAAAAALISVVLAIISLAIIQALCVYCSLLQLVNIAIFVLLLTQLKEKKPKQKALGRASMPTVLSFVRSRHVTGIFAALIISASGSFILVNRMEQQDFSLTSVNNAQQSTPAPQQVKPDTSAPEALIDAHFGKREFSFSKFWEYHALLFENYQKYSKDQLLEYAQETGIRDLELFKRRLDNADVGRRLGSDINEGLAAGISYTPTIYLNGRRVETFRRRGDSH